MTWMLALVSICALALLARCIVLGQRVKSLMANCTDDDKSVRDDSTGDKSTAYGLRARGRGLSVPCDQTWQSEKVFWKKEDAEAFEPEFRKACTRLRIGRYDAISPDSCHVEVVLVEVL